MSNVLVYSGPGVSASALSHTLRTLRRLLPSYDVQCINAQSLALDPWMDSTSLFVLPGGRDLPFVDSLSELHRAQGVSLSKDSNGLTQQRADRRIREYVEERGGSFIGICAGAYYASSACEFERGDAVMQVVGARPALEFFPGTCSGTVFPGFVYESDQGARLVDVAMAGSSTTNQHWSTYYNGGGAFLHADSFVDRGIEVLGRYVEEKEAPVAATSSESKAGIKEGYAGEAAIVRCTPGKGNVILYGTHPEFPVTPHATPAQHARAPDTLPTDTNTFTLLEEERMRQFGQHLQLLGLEVDMPVSSASTESSQQTLSPIVLSARYDEQARSIINNLQSIAAKPSSTIAILDNTPLDGKLLSIADTNDTIHFFDASYETSSKLVDLCLGSDYSAYLSPVVAPTADEARAGQGEEIEMEIDLQKVPKYIVVSHSASIASLDKRLTPHWNVGQFMQCLDASRDALDQLKQETWTSVHRGSMSFAGDAGEQVRLADVHTYAYVVTSTQTMLDKNYRLLTHLPNGLTSFATHQVSGRGRGKNAWISPLGCLQFSTLLRIPSPQMTFWHAGTGAIVFVQYLAGLAIVESIRSGALGARYARALGDKVRIKWPNDVYAQVDGDHDGARKGTFVWRGKRYAKMAGVLINSQFAGSELALVVGCGINTLNARPTTSLSDLIDAWNDKCASVEERLAVVGQEQFAGAILATFERMWNVFVQSGGNFAPFVDAYRRAWLHSDQETLLQDTVPPTKARIVGITSDYGLLRCVPFTDDVQPQGVSADTYSAASWGPSKTPGQWIDLQPDGNSFDMLQNLIRRKE